jgi:arginine decarboxylase
MALEGRALLDHTLRLAAHARAAIDAIPGLRAMGAEVLGLTGYEAADWLRAEQRVTVEMADHRRIMALLTIADDGASSGRLIEGLRALAEMAGQDRPCHRVEMPTLAELQTESALTPRQACRAPQRHLPLERAIGAVAAELITPYPPGIPVLAPGERVTEPIVSYLRRGLEAGMSIPDAADPSLRTLRVVAEGGR